MTETNCTTPSEISYLYNNQPNFILKQSMYPTMSEIIILVCVIKLSLLLLHLQLELVLVVVISLVILEYLELVKSWYVRVSYKE